MVIRACDGYGFGMSMSLLKAIYQLNEPLMATFTILRSSEPFDGCVSTSMSFLWLLTLPQSNESFDDYMYQQSLCMAVHRNSEPLELDMAMSLSWL